MRLLALLLIALVAIAGSRAARLPIAQSCPAKREGDLQHDMSVFSMMDQEGQEKQLQVQDDDDEVRSAACPNGAGFGFQPPYCANITWTQYNFFGWDFMPCRNGACYRGHEVTKHLQGVHDTCEDPRADPNQVAASCPAGWEGVLCANCVNDDVCNAEETSSSLSSTPQERQDRASLPASGAFQRAASLLWGALARWTGPPQAAPPDGIDFFPSTTTGGSEESSSSASSGPPVASSFKTGFISSAIAATSSLAAANTSSNISTSSSALPSTATASLSSSSSSSSGSFSSTSSSSSSTPSSSAAVVTTTSMTTSTSSSLTSSSSSSSHSVTTTTSTSTSTTSGGGGSSKVKRVCDKSPIVAEYKSFDCKTPGGKNALIPAAALTLELNLTDPAHQVVSFSTFVYTTGAPLLFNCSVFDCDQVILPDKVHTTCKRTCCTCSTWCNEFCCGFVSGMKGQADFVCEKEKTSLNGTSGYSCTLSQVDLPIVFDLHCQAAGCQHGVNIFPEPVLDAVSGTIFGLVALFFSSSILVCAVCSCQFAYRRSEAAKAKLWKSVQPPRQTLPLTFANISCSVLDPSAPATPWTRFQTLRTALPFIDSIGGLFFNAQRFVSWQAMARRFKSRPGATVPRLLSAADPLRLEQTLVFEDRPSVMLPYFHKIVLHDVTGICLPGEFTAILGASGAGKTTLMDILSGRKNVGLVVGDVSVGGVPRSKLKNWQRISGYVMQDEKLLGTLTVREHLQYIAQLRLPAIMPDHVKDLRVQEVLEELGLAHVANNTIGTEMERGISGGERRRLAIATELLTDPPILLLDEPTSGLDSSTARALCDTLRRLAHTQGRTVVATIHQPRSNIYEMFDRVMVLHLGYCVYSGPAGEELLAHFEGAGFNAPPHFNPADFVLDVVTNTDDLLDARSARSADSAPPSSTAKASAKKKHAERSGEILSALVSLYQESSHLHDALDFIRSSDGSAPSGHTFSDLAAINNNSAQNTHQSLGISGVFSDGLDGVPMEGKSNKDKVENYDRTVAKYFAGKYASSMFQQVKTLSLRTLVNGLRDPYLLRLQYTVTLCIALALGTIYQNVGLGIAGIQNRAGAMFFMIAMLCFGSMTSIDTFFKERPIYVRERANGSYRSLSYFLAKAFCDVLPLRIVPAMMLVGVVYPMVGFFPAIKNYFVAMMTMVLVSLCSGAVSLTISVITPSVGSGILAGFMINLFALLFAGFLINKDHMPSTVSWMQYGSFIMYAFETMMVNELAERDDLSFDPKGYKSVQITGEAYLVEFGMDSTQIWKRDIPALAGITLGFFCLAWFLLRLTVREAR